MWWLVRMVGQYGEEVVIDGQVYRVYSTRADVWEIASVSMLFRDLYV